jgi:phage gp36-like protein
LLSVIGFEPGSDPDKVVKDRYTLAIGWLRDVQKGAVVPFETAAETEDPDDEDTSDAGAAVYTDASRNWSALTG